jgi:hypothetical protein
MACSLTDGQALQSGQAACDGMRAGVNLVLPRRGPKRMRPSSERSAIRAPREWMVVWEPALISIGKMVRLQWCPSRFENRE